MQPVQRVTLLRRAIQIPALVLTGEWLATGWLRCPFPIPFVSCTTCPLTECPGRYLQIPIIVGIAVASLLGGRLFCGWFCPMGFVEDILGRFPKARALSASQRFTGADRWLKLLKYPALLLTIYAVLATVDYASGRPYPYVVRSSSLFNLEAIGTGVALGAAHYRIRLWMLGAVLVLSLLVTRFWCRYLCPLGAILGVFNWFSAVTIRRSREDLPHCAAYPRDCIQHTAPGTVDCVMCGECVQGCPRKVLRWSLRLRQRAPKTAPLSPEGHDTA